MLVTAKFFNFNLIAEEAVNIFLISFFLDVLLQ
jgi:hypothetical protein